MNNLELLKQQLIAQKEILESKGITVATAHTNPSPSELTNAISNINVMDTTKITATAEDVKQGKTFYDPTGSLATGTLANNSDDLFPTYLNRLLPESFDKDISYQPYLFSDINTPTGKHIVTEGTTTLPHHTFFASNLEQIILPNSLTSFGEECFRDSNNLKSITIPDSVTELPNNCFYANSALEEINFGTGITSIPSRAFYNLPSLKSLVFPANIIEINTSNFNYSNSVESVTFEGEDTEVKLVLFNNKYPTNMKIFVPFTSLFKYLEQSTIYYYRVRVMSKVEITDETEFPTPSTETTKSISLIWATNADDILSKTNLITTPSGAGTYYAGVIDT